MSVKGSKLNIAIKQACSLICNTARNSLIQPEIQNFGIPVFKLAICDLVQSSHISAKIRTLEECLQLYKLPPCDTSASTNQIKQSVVPSELLYFCLSSISSVVEKSAPQSVSTGEAIVSLSYCGWLKRDKREGLYLVSQ